MGHLRRLCVGWPQIEHTCARRFRLRFSASSAADRMRPELRLRPRSLMPSIVALESPVLICANVSVRRTAPAGHWNLNRAVV